MVGIEMFDVWDIASAAVLKRGDADKLRVLSVNVTLPSQIVLLCSLSGLLSKVTRTHILM